MLNIAGALSKRAEVTLVFRKVLEPFKPVGFIVREIEIGNTKSRPHTDDSATRGCGYLEFIKYLWSVKRFIKREMNSFDIVLEKSWDLSGYISDYCNTLGLPAVVVENAVPTLNRPITSPGDFLKNLRLLIARFLVGRYMRKSSLIIVETEELKTALSGQWHLSSSQMEVVGLGVNREFFIPSEHETARKELGISSDSTILLYAGVLDQIHDLSPVIEAMCRGVNSSIELHVVGDGVMRKMYEKKVKVRGKNIIFYGRIPHEIVPRYIAAADLCLAPYNLKAFPNGIVAYSTLKIPEYMASGRAVVSVPSGHVLKLVRDGVSGFLFPNNVDSWIDFFLNFPSRERLAQMGEKASEMAIWQTWEDTAMAYYSLCEQEILKFNGERFTPNLMTK